MIPIYFTIIIPFDPLPEYVSLIDDKTFKSYLDFNKVSFFLFFFIWFYVHGLRPTLRRDILLDELLVHLLLLCWKVRLVSYFLWINVWGRHTEVEEVKGTGSLMYCGSLTTFINYTVFSCYWSWHLSIIVCVFFCHRISGLILTEVKNSSLSRWGVLSFLFLFSLRRSRRDLGVFIQLRTQVVFRELPSIVVSLKMWVVGWWSQGTQNRKVPRDIVVRVMI